MVVVYSIYGTVLIDQSMATNVDEKIRCYYYLYMRTHVHVSPLYAWVSSTLFFREVIRVTLAPDNCPHGRTILSTSQCATNGDRKKTLYAGGDHAFALTDMDVFSLKLATRLQEAGARVILRHTHPHAESPRRRAALKRLPVGSKTTDPDEAGGGGDGERADSAQDEGTSERAVPAPAVQERCSYAHSKQSRK